jgi:hypothetical protein
MRKTSETVKEFITSIEQRRQTAKPVRLSQAKPQPKKKE